MNCEYYRIGRVPIANINYDKAVDIIYSAITEKRKGYVCVSNMRTTTFANQDDGYYALMENSLLNVPDGTPLVWCARWWGIKGAERVCGPHLFDKILKENTRKFKHYFLGDTEDTLAALTQRISQTDGAKVAGYFSPPFLPLEEYDIEGIAKKINDSEANVIWTSLRAPKQDFLGQMLVPLLNDGVVVIGVGAAFRSYLGEYKAPDGILQKMGLAGLKMMRNTTIWKEIRWYIKHIFVLIKYFCIIKWRRLNGKRCDEL